MSRTLRFGTALSALAIATVLSGCAAPMSKRSVSASKSDSSNIGLATRAYAALAAQDFETAVGFGERAVEAKPDDPNLRALLGNIYLAAGRFASAESAYRDSLTLRSNQPDLVLKLSLALIAQGKSGEARGFLEAGAGLIAPADYGLALALAGWPAEAARLLEQAARQHGADPRVRQNLALAHAFAGDWESARIIASQDLPAHLVDSRIHEWMALAKPVRASDQVAALVGITPAASDPGQPVRLALKTGGGEQFAAVAAPAPLPVAAPEPAPQPVPYYAPLPEPVEVAVAQPTPDPATVYVQPITASLTAYSPPPAPAFEAPPAPVAPEAAASLVKPARSVRVALPAASRAPAERAAAPARGNSTSVVQLGAYGSPERVAAAWDQVVRRHASLRGYTPASARFESTRGVVYRLSVKGFVSDSQARDVCVALRREGGSCFVRTIAGDSPVRFAAR
ncbi:MAG TPA: tetratricopeptide repeat protein [Sphingomicrobium sp.]|nr:tetratricopeptide repeat protein [Sphingomicrobium sp.]